MAKGRLIFAEDRCKGCGLCVAACPLKILSLDESRVNKKGYHPVHEEKKDKCIACTNCAVMCPDCIITIERIS